MPEPNLYQWAQIAYGLAQDAEGWSNDFRGADEQVTNDPNPDCKAYLSYILYSMAYRAEEESHLCRLIADLITWIADHFVPMDDDHIWYAWNRAASKNLPTTEP